MYPVGGRIRIRVTLAVRLGSSSPVAIIMRRRYSIVFVAVLWAAFCLLVPERSLAFTGREGKSDVALVLAVDASASIDQTEFMLQLQGIANAFRRPEIIDAIRSGPLGNIHVALLVWAGHAAETSGWFRIGNESEAERFAARIEYFPRRFTGGTNVGNAVMAALALLGDVSANRHCIDLSGDGKESFVPRSRQRSTAPTVARAYAEYLEVTINALAIESQGQDLAQWYRQKVATDDGFVMAIDRLEAFGDAIMRKLIKEIREPVVAESWDH
jgi:Protein of unknown function (DUF1194)